MSWALVQRTPGGSQGSDTDQSVGSALTLSSFGVATTLNNIVLVFCWGSAGSAPSFSCSDNATIHNSWSTLWSAYDATSLLWVALFGATITQNPTGGPTLQPVPVAGGASNITGCAAEFSGGSLTLDGSPVSATGTSATAASGSLATSVANDLVIGLMADTVQASVTITTPTGFTGAGTLQSNGTNFAEGQGCYQIASGTGTFSPSWGTGGGASKSWLAGVLALAPAGSTALGAVPRSLVFVPDINPDPDWME